MSFFAVLRKHKKVSFFSLEFRNGRKSKVKSGLSLNSLWWESRPNKSTWTQDNSGALSWLKPSQHKKEEEAWRHTHTQPTNHQNHCVHCASQDGVCRRVRNHLKATTTRTGGFYFSTTKYNTILDFANFVPKRAKLSFWYNII